MAIRQMIVQVFELIVDNYVELLIVYFNRQNICNIQIKKKQFELSKKVKIAALTVYIHVCCTYSCSARFNVYLQNYSF